MKARMATGLRVAVWSSAALLVMGAAAGTAEAVSGHSSNSPAQGQGGPGPGGGGPGGPGGQGGPFGGAIKGQVVHSISTVKTKSGKYRKEESQQGKVEAVTEESITVTSGDEYSQTYVLSNSTKYFKNGKKVTVSSIATGDTVNVSAKKVGSHYTAVSIFDGKPPTGGKGGGFGFGGGGQGGHGPGGTPPTGQPTATPTSAE